MGLAPFRRLLNDPRFAHCAFIAETPVDEEDDDRRNVATMRALLREHPKPNRPPSPRRQRASASSG